MERCATKIARGHFGSVHIIFSEGKYGLRRKYTRKEEGNVNLVTPLYRLVADWLLTLWTGEETGFGIFPVSNHMSHTLSAARPGVLTDSCWVSVPTSNRQHWREAVRQ